MSRAKADRREGPGLRPGAWEGHPGSLGRALSRRPCWGYKEWGPGQPQEPADQSCGPRCLARPQACTPPRQGLLLSWSPRDEAQPTFRTEGPFHLGSLAQQETALRVP